LDFSVERVNTNGTGCWMIIIEQPIICVRSASYNLKIGYHKYKFACVFIYNIVVLLHWHKNAYENCIQYSCATVLQVLKNLFVKEWRKLFYKYTVEFVSRNFAVLKSICMRSVCSSFFMYWKCYDCFE